MYATGDRITSGCRSCPQGGEAVTPNNIHVPFSLLGFMGFVFMTRYTHLHLKTQKHEKVSASVSGVNHIRSAPQRLVPAARFEYMYFSVPSTVSE